MGITNVFGHGLGSEIMDPVALGSKFVILEVSSSQIPDTEIREFSFNLFDLDTGITLNDVTYFIMVKKENKHLFEGTFQTDDGILTDNPRDKIPPSQVADNSAEYWKGVISSIRNILETPDGSAVP